MIVLYCYRFVIFHTPNLSTSTPNKYYIDIQFITTNIRLYSHEVAGIGGIGGFGVYSCLVE